MKRCWLQLWRMIMPPIMLAKSPMPLMPPPIPAMPPMLGCRRDSCEWVADHRPLDEAAAVGVDAECCDAAAVPSMDFQIGPVAALRISSDSRLDQSNCSIRRLAAPASVCYRPIRLRRSSAFAALEHLRRRLLPPLGPALRFHRRRRCFLLLGFLVLLLFWMFGLLVGTDSESENVGIIKIIQRSEKS